MLCVPRNDNGGQESTCTRCCDRQRHTRREGHLRLEFCLIVAAAVLLVGLTPRAVHAQEKWQADLVISAGPDGSPLNFPNDFVENPVTDELLVVDSYNNRILRYAAGPRPATETTPAISAGDYMGVIDGLTYGGFSTPYGVAVDASGNIVVVNSGTFDAPDDLIQVLSPDGAAELFSVRLSVLTSQTSSRPFRITLAPGTILAPAAEATGTVYVVDGGGSQVVVLNALLVTVLFEFGGELSDPTGLAVDAQGRIYVSDPNNNRVQVFENPLVLASGVDPAVVASLCGYGPPCTVNTPLAYPFGLAIDSNGRLLVADSENNRIAVFSSFADGLQPVNVSIGVATQGVNGPDGCDPIDAGNVCDPDYTPAGPLPDDNYLADLQGPTNIQLDHSGHLLVADASNMRVQRFVQPAMTLSASVAGGTFLTGETITLTVVASTTEPGGLTGVTPTAVPLDFTGASCSASSNPSLVTTVVPLATVPATATVTAGLPVTFTMTFMASSGSGPLVFSAGATGTLANLTTTSAQQTLDAIAINPGGGGPPSTTVTSTPTPPNGTLIAAAGNLGWFIGPAGQPVIHLTGTAGTSQIDWSIDDQTAEHTEPSSFRTQCGSSKDVAITREGHTLLWYRSWNAEGQHEAGGDNENGWQKVTVHWSLGPSADLDYASPNTNNWYNSPVVVTGKASDSFAGLNQVDIVATGVPDISVSSPDSPYSSTFTFPGEGTGLTATVKATSNAGASFQRTATFNIDRTEPVVTSNEIYVRGAATPTLASANSAGWYNTDLDVVFSATDTRSGFPGGVALAGDNLAGRKTVPVIGDGNNLTASVIFEDLADNSSAASSVTGINIDKTAPTLAFGAPVNSDTGASFGGQNGWLDLSSVPGSVGAALNVTASDLTPASGGPGSGVKTVCYDLTGGTTCTPAVLTGGVYPVTVFTAGITSGSIWVIDNAGNQAAAVPFSLKINRFAPVFAIGALNQTTAEDIPLTSAVTATDDDAGDVLTYTLSAVTANGGTLTIVNTATGAYTYTPALNFNGVDTFTVSVTDGKSATPTSATVAITVTAVNDAPSFTAGADVTSNEGAGPQTVAWATAISAGPADEVAQSLNFLVSNTNAALFSAPPAIAANGTLSYTTAAHANGTATVTAQLHDNGGAVNVGDVDTSAAQAFTIRINAVNDAPVAVVDTLAASEETAVLYTAAQLIGNDTDADGDTLAIASVTSGTGGTVALNGDGTVTFTPTGNFSGAASFSYAVTDGSLTSNTATVTVNVAAVNDAPVAVADTLSATEDTSVPYMAAQLIGNDTDVDGPALTIASVTSGAGGTVVLNLDGTVTFTPNANVNGAANFTYAVTDGMLTSNTATVTVSVAAVNDVPVAVADTLMATEDTAVTYAAADLLGNDTDVDGDTLTIASVTSGTGGTVVLNANGTVPFTPNANFNGAASFSYTVTDGSLTSNTATVTVNVAAVNDAAPVAVTDALAATEDTAVLYTAAQLTGNDTDVDGDTLTIASVTSGTGGTVALANGAVTFTPSANFNGAASFGYAVTDGSLTSDTVTVTVNVAAVNDAPVATADTATVAEDSDANAIAVLANDNAEPDTGETLTVTAVTQGAHGSVTFTATGVSYTPAANYNGPDSFTYTIGDGYGGSASATVSVAVTGVNDDPVATADTATVVEGSGANAIAVLANDNTGPDTGETLTVTAVTQGAHGSVTFIATGVSYAPAAGYNGPDSFTYTIGDGSGGSDTATVSVTVRSLNANPVCTAAFADPTLLWPPNHRQIPITINGITDPDGDTFTITVTGIFQDEPTNTDGDGNTAIDGGGVGTSRPWVRAERLGSGDGRVYRIAFTADDGKGGSCPGEVTTSVPHDKSGRPAVDSGTQYDSTVAGPFVHDRGDGHGKKNEDCKDDSDSPHHDGDGCDHDLRRKGHRDGDRCEHDRARATGSRSVSDGHDRSDKQDDKRDGNRR